MSVVCGARSSPPPPETLIAGLQALADDATWSNVQPHFGTRAAQTLAANAQTLLSSSLPALPSLPSQPSGSPTFPEFSLRQATEFATSGLAPLQSAGDGLARVGEGLARAAGGVVGPSGGGWGDVAAVAPSLEGLQPHFGTRAAAAAVSQAADWAGAQLAGGKDVPPEREGDGNK